MNDNRPEGAQSKIEMIAGNEKLTVVFSRNADTELVELASRTLRAKRKLAYVEMQDFDGGMILAYRGEHPEGRFSL